MAGATDRLRMFPWPIASSHKFHLIVDRRRLGPSAWIPCEVHAAALSTRRSTKLVARAGLPKEKKGEIHADGRNTIVQAMYSVYLDW
jgi:hypothetical protein